MGYMRYARRTKDREIGKTGIKYRANVSKTGGSVSLSKGPITWNSRRGFTLNLGKYIKGLSFKS